MGIRYLPGQEPGGERELLRRGFQYGWIAVDGRPSMPSAEEVKRAWAADEAIFLPGILADSLPRFREDIAQAHNLMELTREGAGLSELLEAQAFLCAALATGVRFVGNQFRGA